MSRSRRITAAAVLGCSLLAVAAVAPADAAARGPAPAGGSSGYVAQGGRYTSVAASWTQPAFSCAGGGTGASYWVGLDGMTDATAEQAGTSTECSGGVASMSAWYELYPAAPVYFANPVSAGDRLSASVSTGGTGTFTLKVTDVTKGWSQSANRSLPGAQLSSAEVMTDVPASGTGGGTAPGGSVLVSFTGATVDGQPLGASSPTAVEAPGTVVSPLTGGEAFTVSRG
ncbi:G1 family endopeptidase [Streptomyces sp. SL13]|uniref:G1 family endopeptidase n=1 Tax=Streptantibioticus silvisoli TaxID=2705255 RepID=A0AA90HBI0_9ACTN|nr:G1 family glutamic endopeptidase [Streptantibioticus silvisoli]MDI5972590.1 G1 family endopeptidase [Streptantibioticus silvisoli]